MTSESRDAVELVALDPDNLRRDLSSPTVRGLVGQGYVPGPAFTWQATRDAPLMLMVMFYQQPQPRAETPVVGPRPDTFARVVLAGLLVLQIASFALKLFA